MDNFFLKTNTIKCDYAMIRLNKKKTYKERLIKSYQSYNLSEKDYISIEEILTDSSASLCKGIDP